MSPVQKTFRLPRDRRPAALPLAILGAATLVLTGCVNNDMSDLEAYIQQVKSVKSSRIEPLPEIKIAEVFIYEPGNRPNPFKPFLQEESKPEVVARATGGIQPPANHVREELEYYPLDALRMVGTLEKGDEFWGLVVDPEGAVHRVQTGNYMGRNYGKITDVSEEAITLVEIVPDNLGGWQERPAELALAE